jgi:predicted nucleic-acid-binding protein
LRGLDTNLLLRYITEDDPGQTNQVRLLFEQAEDRKELFYVSVILICELAWTLRCQPYLFDRARTADILQQILETNLFVVQDRDLTRRAIVDYRQGRADFPDYLMGWQNRSAGCEDTLTFDRKLRRTEGFTVLS